MVVSMKQTAPPAVEPMTLTEAKQHLRVDIADDDALITALIVAAREACENFTRSKLITQTWEIAFDSFPTTTAPIALPIAPLLSVQSVAWADQNNATTTLVLWSNGTGDYLVDTESEPGRIVLPPNTAWPGSSLWPVQPVKVAVTAGYGATEAAVPASLVQGMKLCLGHWYENRETVSTSGAIGKEIPMTAEYLWWPYRFFNYAYMRLDA